MSALGLLFPWALSASLPVPFFCPLNISRIAIYNIVAALASKLRREEILQNLAQPSSYNRLKINIAVRYVLLDSKVDKRTSLVVQRLRIHLAMQGTQVQSPVGGLRSHKP